DDGDGFGDDSVTYESCVSTAPSGYVEDGGDCDDASAAYNPAAAEADCTDPNDYNCDGSVGYADDDLDGFAACEDCDDTEAAANSGEVEACDGIDNDCDGTVDEDDAVDAATWYADDDGDGYGDSAATDISCDAPSGYVADATDCDDGRGATNPGATEYCNSVDDDCDGSVDESDADDVSTWYYDQDGDGYGEESTSLYACDAPVGYIATAGDCDDDASGVNPSATEVCDSADTDEDCDGSADDDDASATGQVTWYVDDDGDGMAGTDVGDSCDQPDGEPAATSTYGDCDEDDDDNYVGATEVADGEDNDCDGEVDE
ncbi:MAG: MopE-related protein, partial [Phycisphaerales bacterium]|nr:MopE-related protein [Phycisphaerales bacterium]